MSAITSGSSSDSSSGFIGQRSQFTAGAVRPVHRCDANANRTHSRREPGDSQGVGANEHFLLHLEIRILPEASRLSSQLESVPHSIQSAGRSPLLRREKVERDLSPLITRESNEDGVDLHSVAHRAWHRRCVRGAASDCTIRGGWSKVAQRKPRLRSVKPTKRKLIRRMKCGTQSGSGSAYFSPMR